MWRQLDPVQWELTHNPWGLLQTVSRDQPGRALADPGFRGKVDALVQSREHAAAAPAWFQHKYPKAALTCAAYFSMEFMLSESLPIYSGGLGNVAGDQLKAASDLGVPVVGVGLLYQQGYFRQTIGKDGAQQALYPYNDPGAAADHPCAPPERRMAAIGNRFARLFGLAARVAGARGKGETVSPGQQRRGKLPVHRGITSELYGGGPELRLQQEILLGIGGWRLLAALGIQPEVCHLNEGHAAFAVLERARSFMAESGQSFEVALAVTRAGNLFTTHTAVPAGFDRFSPALIEPYFAGYVEKKLGLAVHDFMALGRQNPERLVGKLQHGVSRHPRERGGERREPPARESEPASLRAPFPAVAGR